MRKTSEMQMKKMSVVSFVPTYNINVASLKLLLLNMIKAQETYALCFFLTEIISKQEKHEKVAF
jgi:hypothetical protein